MVYSDTGVGNHAGSAGSWRVLSTAKPAPTIDASVSRWVWQLPINRGHTVASASFCSPPANPRAAHVLEVAQFAARTQQRKQLPQNGVRIVDRAQHQRAHHRVERFGLAESRKYDSTVPAVTVTGIGAFSAASRACGASRRSGSTATTSVTVAG